MTYREAFDHLGQPRRSTGLRRQYRTVIKRWLGVMAFIIFWAVLTGWLDGVA